MFRGAHFTLMEQEARETPQVVKRQLLAYEKLIFNLNKRLTENPQCFAMTIGRGSSDHACTFAKYLLETKLNLVTASAAPSTVTLYNAKLKMDQALVIGISQSGQSPDICKMLEAAKKSHAITLALVNEVNSPLAKIAEYVVPLWAGEEKAVAATKSYVASLTALVQLVAHLSYDQKLIAAVNKLPESLAEVITEVNWDEAISVLKNIDRTLVIARGFSFPIAQEIALKFKETAGIQAEAFSSAEVLHGPFALVKRDHPFLLFMQDDATLPGNLELAKKIKQLHGKIILVVPKNLLTRAVLHKIADFVVLLPESIDPRIDSIHTVLASYLMIARLSVLRGFNPDAPDNLKKITETF